MQLKNEHFFKEFNRILLDKIFYLSCHKKNSSNEDERAKTVFLKINTKNDPNYSKKFYLLLLEMFDFWHSDSFFNQNEKILSKFKVLSKSQIKFPRKQEFIFIYTDQVKEHIPLDQNNNNENMNLLLDGIEDTYNMIDHFLENNDKSDEFFDDLIFSFKNNFDNLQESNSELNLKQKKAFLKYQVLQEILLENQSYQNIKNEFIESQEQEQKEQNPFLEKDFKDYSSSKKIKKNIDIISNESVHVKPNKEKQDDKSILYDFILNEKEELLEQLNQLENQLQKTQLEKDKNKNKFEHQNIQIQKKQKEFKDLKQQNSEISKQLNKIMREISSSLNVKNSNYQKSKINTYDKSATNNIQLIENDFNSRYHESQNFSIGNIQNQTSDQKISHFNQYKRDIYNKQTKQSSFNLPLNNHQKVIYPVVNIEENDKSSQNIDQFKNSLKQNKEFMNTLNSDINNILKRGRTSQKYQVGQRTNRSNSLLVAPKFSKNYDLQNSFQNPYTIKNQKTEDESNPLSKYNNRNNQRLNSSLMDDYIKKYQSYQSINLGSNNSAKNLLTNNLISEKDTKKGIFRFKNLQIIY